MKAVILAAGRGTRLWPLTEYTPKPLLPVGGRPLLEWMIQRVREAGVEDVLIVTNHLEEQIRAHLGDGSALGARISYARQDELLGTADAFKVAGDWAAGDEFMGLYGDHYLAEGTLRRIVSAHRPGEVTVAALEVDDPSQYGAFALEGDRVVRVVEKPPRGTEPSKYANVGVYVFPPKVFEYIGRTQKSPRGEYEITDTLQLMIDDGATVVKHDLGPLDWMDIGLPWTLLEANERAMAGLKHSVEGEVEEGARIHGPVWIKRGARVRSGAYIEGPVVVGEGSDVGPNCYIRAGTCLCRDVRIGNACEVKNSIVMDGTHAAHLSYIGDSVLGKKCNLGAGTITANLRFDKSPIEVAVKGERLNSGRRKLGVIMGDNAQTGVNVSIHPGVVIGPDTWIAPGLIIQRDVPARVIKFRIPDNKENPR